MYYDRKSYKRYGKDFNLLELIERLESFRKQEKMKYTKKDVKEGKVIVLNDGTLEQLCDVLGTLTDYHGHSLVGVCHYYYFENGRLYVKNEKGELPHRIIQSAKDFSEEWVPKFGERVQVRQHESQIWSDRIYMSTIKQAIFPFFCCDCNDESKFLRGEFVKTMVWKHMRKAPKEYTKQEIADCLNIDVNDLKIKE